MVSSMSVISDEDDSLVSLLTRHEQLRARHATFRLTEQVVRVYCRYCRVTVSDPYESEAAAIKRRRFGWWSDLYYCSFWTAVCHLSCNLYHQYKLDFKILHRNRLGELMVNVQDDGRASLLQELQDDDRSIDDKRQLLQYIGAPNMNLSFAIECVYLMAILLPTLCYLVPLIFLNHMFKFDVYLVRLLVDYEREFFLCQRLIDRQVAEYVNSSRNFDRMHQEARRKLYLIPTWRHSVESQQHYSRPRPSEDRFVERLLVGLRNRHKLLPCTRKPEWSLFWQIPFVSMCLFAIVYGLSFTLYVIVMLNHLSPNSKSINQVNSPAAGGYTWRDYLVMGETSILLIAVNLASTFYGALFLFICIDCSACANHMRKLVCKCIRLHRAHIERLAWLQSRNSAFCALDVPERDLMNSEVLYLLVHYKIYMRLLTTIRTLFGFVTLSCLLMMTVIPLVTHLHVPYFQSEIDKDVKIFLTVLSLMVLLIAMAFCMPACYADKRNSDLHKQLTYLEAHIVFVRTQTRFDNFYHEHLVSLLHRECGDPHSIHAALTLFGSNITYSYQNIMRLYFWFGLILVSIYSRARER